MPDPIAFERLGLACLRHLAPAECASLIHLGSNPEGKAANSKLDAFTRVPWSSPPLFVAAHFTAEKKTRLRGKWLGVSKTPQRRKKRPKRNPGRSSRQRFDADIPKSIREAAAIRATFPDALFKLYLITNRLVDQTLQTDVYQSASATDPVIDVEIVEQSRLSGFLDQDKEGQYLRQAFLNIPASRVSRSLLADTGRRMLDDRRRQPDMAEARYIIARSVQEPVRAGCATTQHSLVWLVAEPGKGKSLVAMAELQRHLDRGGVALWLDDGDIVGVHSLEEAIVRGLKRLLPNVHYDDAAEVLSFFSPTDRLVVLVDDVNRANDPSHALAQIRAWAERLARSGTEGQIASESRIVILCPVWQRHLKHSDSTKEKATASTWECAVEIEDFTAEEASSLLNQTTLSLELRETVHQLAGDEPYLTGWLANTLTACAADSNRTHVPSLDELLDERLRYVTIRNSGRAASEFADTILELGRWMLLSHQLAPAMRSVVAAFRDSPRQPVLRDLLSDGTIIYQAHDQLRFSHDRLRDIWLARAVPGVVDRVEVCSEPHFAEIIGRALADDRLAPTQLKTIIRTNPLALFCAWQLLSSRPDSASRPPVLAAIRSWLSETKPKKDRWDSVTWEITKKLATTSDPVVVLECYELLPPRPLLMLAALRNGVVAAGIRYVQRIQWASFPPTITDPWLDRALSVAMDKQRATVVSGLTEALSSREASKERLEASIVLAGFFGLSEFGPLLVETWTLASAQQREDWLGAYLWATARCLGENAPTAWASGLETWLTLSSESAGPHSPSPRWNVAGWQLARARGPWLSDLLAVWIGNLVETGHALHEELSTVLRKADTPSAVEYVIREQGKRRRKDPKSFGLGFWLSMGRPGGGRDKLDLSVASLARLHSIWSDENEADDDREAALAYWCAATDGVELPRLFDLPSDSFLQATALPHRAKLRDATCVPLIIKHLPEHPHWLSMLPAVWTRLLIDTVNQMLASYESPGWQHQTFELLIAIPPEDAEFLILANASKLRSDPKMLQAAALAGTPHLRNWVFEVGRDLAELRGQVFEHVGLELTMGRTYQSPAASLSRWLRNLEPFLDWLSPKELEHFTEEWIAPHFLEWVKGQIMPRLPSEIRIKHAHTKENLIAMIREDSVEDHWDWTAGHFLERAQAQGWKPERLLETIYAWATQRGDDFSYVWLASCIARVGTRADLKLLDALLLLRSTEKLACTREDTDFIVRRRTL